jgi:hypothetical protein
MVQSIGERASASLGQPVIHEDNLTVAQREAIDHIIITQLANMPKLSLETASVIYDDRRYFHSSLGKEPVQWIRPEAPAPKAASNSILSKIWRIIQTFFICGPWGRSTAQQKQDLNASPVK